MSINDLCISPTFKDKDLLNIFIFKWALSSPRGDFDWKFFLYGQWNHIARCISSISFQTTDRRNMGLNTEGKLMPPHRLREGSNEQSAPWKRLSEHYFWCLFEGKAAPQCNMNGKVSYKRCPVQSNLLRGNSVETGLTGSSKLQETMTWEHQHKSFSVTASTPFYAAVSIETHKVTHGQFHIRLCVCVFHFPWWQRGNPVL